MFGFYCLRNTVEMLLNFDFEKFSNFARRKSLECSAFPQRNCFIFFSLSFFCDYHGRVLKKDCRGEWKTSSTCCCWWCTRSEKCAAVEWEKKLQFFFAFHFAFFRSTVNKSYTSSSASFSIVFPSAVGPFFYFFVLYCFPPSLFTKCIDREKKPQYYALWSKTINLFKHSVSE